jgi:hypothetical protein
MESSGSQTCCRVQADGQHFSVVFVLKGLHRLVFDVFSASAWLRIPQRPSKTSSQSKTITSYFSKPSRPPLASGQIRLAWARFFIRKNLAFNLLDSPEFKEAISVTSGWGSEIRVGGRTNMTTALISRLKKSILDKIHVLLLTSFPGLKCCRYMFFLAFRLFPSICLRPVLSGSLALDGWKSKYQKSHLFGSRFSFITSDWSLLNIVSLCDAGRIYVLFDVAWSRHNYSVCALC